MRNRWTLFKEYATTYVCTHPMSHHHTYYVTSSHCSRSTPQRMCAQQIIVQAVINCAHILCTQAEHCAQYCLLCTHMLEHNMCVHDRSLFMEYYTRYVCTTEHCSRSTLLCTHSAHILCTHMLENNIWVQNRFIGQGILHKICMRNRWTLFKEYTTNVCVHDRALFKQYAIVHT